MITLQILPASGNANNFPFTGVLGVSDVIVRGRLVAALDERASGKPPEARRIAVRLVRVDGWEGKVSRETVRDVVDEKTLWTPEDGADAERFSPREYRFSLRVPHDTQGLSKMQFKVGACQASVTWRIEAYVDTVKDGRIEAQYSRPLSLVRHSTIPLLPRPYPHHSWSSTACANSPAPFDYDLRIPNEPFGVLEPVAVDTHFRLPPGSGVQIKSFKLWLRRDVTNLKSGAHVETVHEFAIDEEPEPAARRSRPPKRFASVFSRSSTSVTPSTTTTPPSEDERTLHGRTPSPPSDVEHPALAPHRFPIVAHDTVEVAEKGRFRMRIPGQGPHRWTVGETGESSVFRISFAIAGKITYKQRNGGSSTLDLAPVPVHVCAAVDSKLTRETSRTSMATTLVSRLGDRRNSDFALQLKFDRTSPGPTNPPLASPDAGIERRLSAAHLPRPSPIRPNQGRRMSEQSEGSGAPARTRVRRDPSAPLPVPNATIPSPSSESSTMPAVSRSSTVESFGPDTPSTMEFLTTPVVSAHLSPKLPSSFPHHPPSHSPQASRHGHRASRSSAARYRPRSAGSQRSSILGDSARSVSNLSIASLASVSSASSDPLRPMPPAGSSSTLLASADRMLGLSLGDEGTPMPGSPSLFAQREEEEADAPMLDYPVQSPHLPSPSPPSSPEPPSPMPNLAIASAFSNPFALDDSAPFGVGKEPPVIVPEMYVSPRHAARLAQARPSTAPAFSQSALPAGVVAPASPLAQHGADALPKHANLLLSPPMGEASMPSSRRGSLAPSSPGSSSAPGTRKGSIGVFISNILSRRGSKTVPAP
ncbi:hypothetical protein JCM10450v2_007842 [Rhodotorula kratochvilovae]